jgi:hypothetical protein
MHEIFTALNNSFKYKEVKEKIPFEIKKLISEKRKFYQISIKTNNKFYLFCCQYMYDMINSKLINFYEKKSSKN